jgi:GNAT superfamily N-acetyltransferase
LSPGVIDPTVRRSELADVTALTALEAEARRAVAETRGGARWLQLHEPIGSGWTDVMAARSVFVAELDGGRGATPVGYLVADVRDDAERVLVVEQVFVHPEARELGFGDALLAAAADHGRASGATLIEGETLPGDRTIKNLYERAGITARLIIVSSRL